MLVIVSNFPHTAPLFLNIIPMFGVEVCSHQYIVIPTYDFKSCRECSRPFSGGMFGCNSPKKCCGHNLPPFSPDNQIQ
jgi:hypothetical protein